MTAAKFRYGEGVPASMPSRRAFADVPDYIRSFPKPVQAKLRTLRRTIREAVPQAEEHISYQIPSYRFHGRLLYFAAFKEHYSIYATTRATERAFEKELAKYATSKRGTVRFPMDTPVPVRLIARIAKFRAKENLAAKKPR